MDMEIIDLRSISEPDARAIAEIVCAIWPKPERTVQTLTADIMRRWRGYQRLEAQYPRSFLIRDGRRVIAHATIEPRSIGTSIGDMTILALSRVCTDPAARGQHLGETVASAAFKLVDDGTFPFALFQTTEDVKPFYERLGAIRIDNTFVNSLAADPKANAFWTPVVMRYPAKPGWPLGEIDLRGPGW